MSLLATPERPEQQGPLDLPALRAQTVRMEPMAQQEQLDLLALREPTVPMARPVQQVPLALREQTVQTELTERLVQLAQPVLRELPVPLRQSWMETWATATQLRVLGLSPILAVELATRQW